MYFLTSKNIKSVKVTHISKNIKTWCHVPCCTSPISRQTGTFFGTNQRVSPPWNGHTAGVALSPLTDEAHATGHHNYCDVLNTHDVFVSRTKSEQLDTSRRMKVPSHTKWLVRTRQFYLSPICRTSQEA